MATGAVLLAHVAFLRVFCRASESWVTVFGRRLTVGCWFREQAGIPCPGCGLTRSLVLSAAGQVETAARLNVLGPLMVGGALAFGLALVALSLLAVDGRGAARVERAMRLGGQAYAALYCCAWLGGWLMRLA